MIKSLRLRWAIIAAVFLISVIWAVPNFIDTTKNWWPSSARMTKGLDIQGGSHLVLRVDTDAVFKQESEKSVGAFKKLMGENKLSYTNVEVNEPLVGGLKITYPDSGAREKGEAWISEYWANTYQTVDSSGTTTTVRYPEVYLNQQRERMLEQAIETIRNRIDEFGVSEPSIAPQGTDRILVQLPGIQDAATAKELINRTARLDFMILSQEKSRDELQALITEVEVAGNFTLENMKYSEYIDKLNEALKGKIPASTIVYFEKDESAATMEAGRIPYLLRLDQAVGGDKLVNAFVTSGEFGRPEVAFSFDGEGTRLFADLTTTNEKQQMAIVLDKVIKSAPVIQTPITQGNGRITLGSTGDPNKTFKEANLIALTLRAGALPAPLEQLEERTVGPSLGSDAIRQGAIASYAACIAVFAFIIMFYRGFGVVAALCLTFNILIVVAVLSALRATLTLPGIAGMALTLGMAVDANVIIYERVKEELNRGLTLMAAIREGYDRAFSSIFDANLTTVIVCLILMYYGTGPIRGFAVTLTCGLAASMFTSIFFTRAVFDLLVGRWKWNLNVGWGR